MPSVGDRVLYFSGRVVDGYTYYQATVSVVHSDTVIDLSYSGGTVVDVENIDAPVSLPAGDFWSTAAEDYTWTQDRVWDVCDVCDVNGFG